MVEEEKRQQLTDEELEALGIEIPETETDASFFQWVDDMIEEVFRDVAPPRKQKSRKSDDDHIS